MLGVGTFVPDLAPGAGFPPPRGTARRVARPLEVVIYIYLYNGMYT